MEASERNDSLRQVVRSLGAKSVKFYYNSEVFNGTLKNISTVCLILGNGKVLSRGIAICSMRDQHEKTQGRNRSFGRAIRALKNKTSSDPINADLNRFKPIKRLKKSSVELLYPLTITKSIYGPFKSVFEPVLTTKEVMILGQ